MTQRRWVVVLLPVSAALHGLGLLALLWVVSRPAELPPLFVDLSTLELDGASSTPAVVEQRRSSRGARGWGVRAAARAGSRGDVPERAPAPAKRDGGSVAALATVAPPAGGARELLPTPREEREEARAAVPEARESLLVPAPAPGLLGIQGPAPEPSAPRSFGAGDAVRRGGNPGSLAGQPGGGQGTGPEPGGPVRGGGGSALAASAPGTGPGGAEYGPYLAQWRRRIHENVRYPLVARRRSLTGTVQLDIVIQADGAIASVQIAESSAHGVLDEAAIVAVRGLPPLPFPSHLAPRPLRARLPIVFDLQ